MRFANGIAEKYRSSVEQAFEAIVANGDASHRQIADAIRESDLLIKVLPVSKINASGVTGLIDASDTNDKIEDEHLGQIEALGELYIAIAEETIDTGGQRGCEGTLVHEGRHAWDFAKTIASFSNAEVNPLSVSDPTLYELELAAHETSGDYMICVNKDDYVDEGIDLMILGRPPAGGPCYVDGAGIDKRLCDSYGLTPTR